MTDTPPAGSNAEANPGGDGQIVSGRDVAQGRTGSRTFVILILSIALLVVLFAIVYGLAAPHLGSHHGAGGQSGVTSAQQAESFHTAPPSPKQAPPGSPSTEPGAQPSN